MWDIQHTHKTENMSKHKCIDMDDRMKVTREAGLSVCVWGGEMSEG